MCGLVTAPSGRTPPISHSNSSSTLQWLACLKGRKRSRWGKSRRDLIPILMGQQIRIEAGEKQVNKNLFFSLAS
jgi:hypothetical protein